MDAVLTGHFAAPAGRAKPRPRPASWFRPSPATTAAGCRRRSQDQAQIPRCRTFAILALPELVFERRRKVITGIYGFGPEVWEALATPRVEAFNPAQA